MNTLAARRLAIGHRTWVLALVIAGFLAPVVLQPSDSKLLQLDYVLILIIVTIGLNIAIGLAGQYLMGLGVVFAIGGYAGILMAVHAPQYASLLVLCLLGVVTGTIGGLIVGLPALRVTNFYLALVSMFAALALPAVAAKVTWLGREAGLSAIAVLDFQPKLAGRNLYWTFLTMTFAAVALNWAIKRSRMGRRFEALHANEHLASTLGISPLRAKILAVAVASAIAGCAGGMYVYSQGAFGPGTASVAGNILLVAALVIGGTGSIWGAVVGGLLVFGTGQFLIGLGEFNDVVFGVALLLCVVFAPSGIVNLVRNRVIASARAKQVAESAQVRKPAVDAPLDSISPDENRSNVRQEPGGQRAGWPMSVPKNSGSLVVRGVSKTFGGVTAVDNASLTVRPGTIHGLIGSNGSGKTTLLNLICGFYRADAGEILLDGQRIDSLPPFQRARRGLARTFQSPRMIEGYATALDNVVVGADRTMVGRDVPSLLGLPSGRRADQGSKALARRMLAEIGVEHVATVEAAALPHGTRRLVELARAAAMSPRFVLLDEPAAGLSVHELELVTSAIQRMADAGIGVLLIEHNVPEVLRLAAEVTVMHQGRIIFQGTPEQLRADEKVANAFLGITDSEVQEVPA